MIRSSGCEWCSWKGLRCDVYYTQSFSFEYYMLCHILSFSFRIKYVMPSPILFFWMIETYYATPNPFLSKKICLNQAWLNCICYHACWLSQTLVIKTISMSQILPNYPCNVSWSSAKKEKHQDLQALSKPRDPHYHLCQIKNSMSRM